MSRQQRASLDFYLGTVLVISVFGAVTQRLLAGEWPESAKDFLMQAGNPQPETGEKEIVFTPAPVSGNHAAHGAECHADGLFGGPTAQRHPHDLRHTYATILLMDHISPAYVQKQLGHHSISETVDTYGHWIPGGGRGMLDKALRGPKAKPGQTLSVVIGK